MFHEKIRTVERLIKEGIFTMNGTTPNIFIKSIQVMNHDTIEVKFTHADLTDECQECVWYFSVEYLATCQ